MRIGIYGVLIFLIGGCASTPTGDSPTVDTDARLPPSENRPSVSAPSVAGSVDVDVSDVAGRSLPARVELKTIVNLQRTAYEIPTGVQTIRPGVGDYYAFVYVYDNKVPVMVHAQELRVREGETAYILVNLLEGASGKLSVRDYDQDNDLVIDKVELFAGTDPEDPASIPGRRPVRFDERVFDDRERWYKGELHSVSTYGGGEESVAELVRRAESAGLDFLAITDLNTMDACNDPDFRSDSVVLIPALAWGTPEQGIGLVYGPATLPDLPSTWEAAQAECVRIQSQGGVFVIAHPCFPAAPWKWGLGFVNAIQVWNGPWRSPSPLRLSDLPESIKIREPGTGQLVRSIAAAAAVIDKTAAAAAAAKRKDLGISANDQAALFWDYELVRGAICSVVAGGMVNRRDIPMGRPVTWVKAPNKSAAGILHGLRMGQTYVSNHPGGVEIAFNADSLNDGRIDVGVGGVVPLKIEVAFHITIRRAQGAKVQLLRDGHPIFTKSIDSNKLSIASLQTMDYPSIYRIRVIRHPEKPREGFGPVEVLALSSPIYSADIAVDLLRTGSIDTSKTWVRLDSEFVADDPRVRGN